MNRERLIDELTREEALRLTVYPDSKGIPTIGIGRNLRDRGISKEEAYHLCHNDIDEVEAQLNDHCPWWSQLDEVRQRVLADMVFNMGIRTVLTFAPTLGLIATGDYEAAVAHLRHSLWHKQVGVRAERLEQALLTGVMP
jgi:lysozyme